MDAFVFCILFLFSMLLGMEAFDSNCLVVKCSDDGPDISFPFRVTGRQHQHCGLPGFELVCKENATMIEFPTYGRLVVKSISYDIRKLSLLDPKNCVHEVFLNLNLSVTPFQFFFVLKNYTYLTCSTKLSSSFIEVPCLGTGSGNHVYTIESSLPTPDSCRPLKSIAIPFSYSPYLADNSFGLGLTWSLPGCEDCEAEGGQCVLRSRIGLQTGCLNIAQDKGFSFVYLVSGEQRSIILNMLICIFAVTMMISIKICHSKEEDEDRK